MRLGIVADIHGNDVALRAVLDDAEDLAVDRWWALGDLVLFGPRPAEVLQMLCGLPGIGMLRGNTDRYVLTGEQPAPHKTAADAVGSPDLVERYARVAAGIAWTSGVLDQAGLLHLLDDLPAWLRLELDGGTRVLGVHASPLSDDDEGIAPDRTDDQLGSLLVGCAADVVVGGHTHSVTDRLVDGIRVLNPGSTGMPRATGAATWILLDDAEGTLSVTHRSVPFDTAAISRDLRARRHPNAAYFSSVLTG